MLFDSDVHAYEYYISAYTAGCRFSGSHLFFCSDNFLHMIYNLAFFCNCCSFLQYPYDFLGALLSCIFIHIAHYLSFRCRVSTKSWVREAYQSSQLLSKLSSSVRELRRRLSQSVEPAYLSHKLYCAF